MRIDGYKLQTALVHDMPSICKLGVITLHTNDTYPETSDTHYRAIMRDLQRDKCVFFNAVVSLWVDGSIVGQDFLGECHYNDYKGFWTTYHSEYFSDMIATCESEYLQNRNK